MGNGRYIVTRSNYTIKKKHKLLSSDTIYERDYMTTSSLGGGDNGAIPYGEGNFKIIYNDEANPKRKHKYGKWLKNENDENSEFFSLSTLNASVNSSLTSETKIVYKPNKYGFSDFVYYGNCTELIRTSIEDIITKFPAELYVTSDPVKYFNKNDEAVYLGSQDYVRIDNPFNIDIVTDRLSNADINADEFNSLRYFVESFTKYVMVFKDGTTSCITSWEVESRKMKCFNNGEKTAIIKLKDKKDRPYTIYQYYLNGGFVLMIDKRYAGRHIRLCNKSIINSFNQLDEFENFLLDRESAPIYTIEIDTPEETETGTIITKKRYTWPLSYGSWNIDVSSGKFLDYYNKLLNISEWYDENKVDNLWRNMTHDAIKNMDHTYTNTSKDEDNEDYRFATSQLRGLFYAIGRQFDDIKRSIDNVKTANAVTYDENNNTPDYFLSDQDEIAGWEVTNIGNEISETETDVLFEGNNKTYTASDANLAFSRNLKMNSNAIFTRKGTKAGIEMVLALFGYTSYDWAKHYYDAYPDNKKVLAKRWSQLDTDEQEKLYDYEINEYVAVVNNTDDDVVLESEILPLEKYSTYKKNYNTEENTGEAYGLPVRIVHVSTINDEGDIVQQKYVIPWFNKTDTLDGEPYFQMYGGWGKHFSQIIVPDKELYPCITSITETADFKLYDETKKYLKVANTIYDLTQISYSDIEDGDIFFVNDISDISNYYSNLTPDTASNYFWIKEKGNCGFYGEKNGETGWQNLTKKNFSWLCDEAQDTFNYFTNVFGVKTSLLTNFQMDNSSSSFGLENIVKKTIYLENIIENSVGNNPHIGYGNYDDGQEYLNYFRQIFKGTIENDMFDDNAFDCETGEILNEITNYGFDLTDNVIDNVKVWYFTDTTKKRIYRLYPSNSTAYDDDEEFDIETGYKTADSQIVKVGKNAYNGQDVSFKSELETFNLETQKKNTYDEAEANSVINIKKLSLTFNNRVGRMRGFAEYFAKTILPYVKQVIPSTTIFEYKIN